MFSTNQAKKIFFAGVLIPATKGNQIGDGLSLGHSNKVSELFGKTASDKEGGIELAKKSIGTYLGFFVTLTCPKRIDLFTWFALLAAESHQQVSSA